MAEYFSATRWDGVVDLSWYNGTDTEFTLTTPAQLAGVAELVNGQTSAETTRWRIKGDTTTEETFTRSDLKALASGGAVGYQFWKKGTENLVAATEYVTLDALLQSAGASFREEMYVTAADATGFSAQLSYVDYTSCRYYVTADGDKIDAPAALALTWASGTGTLEEAAAKAENSGSIRFCYGISADQYGSAAGKRLVSGVTSVTLTACAHTARPRRCRRYPPPAQRPALPL